MKITSEDKKRLKGFTLVELLVVIAIIGVLATLIFSGMKKARQKAELAQCSAVLRNIGLAVQSFATDHKAGLPGPMNRGLYARYDGRSKQLLSYIGPYLGLPEEPTGEIAREFVCPGWLREATSDDAVCWWSIRKATDAGGNTFDPWGYVTASSATFPQKVWRLGEPADTQAIVDVDAEMGGGWAGTPRCPVHGKVRNVLYFDWHVEAIPVNKQNRFD